MTDDRTCNVCGQPEADHFGLMCPLPEQRLPVSLDGAGDPEDLARLVEHPPPGWWVLTVRLANHDGTTFRESKTLISAAELRESPARGLADRYAMPMLAAVSAAVGP